MAPYSRKRAKPFSACLLVIAAVRVVWKSLETDQVGFKAIVLCHGRHDQLYLAVINVANVFMTAALLTDIHMRLVSFEDSRICPCAKSVVAKDSIDSV